MRASDVARAAVREIRTDRDGRRIATLRFRHARYRTDRWWSWHDLAVIVPPASGPLQLADEVEIVLASRADAARVADAPGHYSCRLHPAEEAPVLPPERSSDGVYGGLIERSEPPNGGDLLLHLGSGLTSLLQLTGEGPFPPEALAHGEWAEFILIEPHEVALLRVVAGRAPRPS